MEMETINEVTHLLDEFGDSNDSEESCDSDESGDSKESSDSR